MSQFQGIDSLFRPAETRDAHAVFARIRDQDYAEMSAASGPDVEGKLVHAVSSSQEAITFEHQGQAVCVFGLQEIDVLGTTASPWLIGADSLSQHTALLARTGRAYMREALKVYPRLVNFVDTRNIWSKVYLRRIGFTLDEPVLFGVAGLPFHRFHMRRKDV